MRSTEGMIEEGGKEGRMVGKRIRFGRDDVAIRLRK